MKTHMDNMDTDPGPIHQNWIKHNKNRAWTPTEQQRATEYLQRKTRMRQISRKQGWKKQFKQAKRIIKAKVKR